MKRIWQDCKYIMHLYENKVNQKKKNVDRYIDGWTYRHSKILYIHSQTQTHTHRHTPTPTLAVKKKKFLYYITKLF